MKPISKAAKTRYFTGYIGQTYFRNFKHADGSESTVGPYRFSGNCITTVDSFWKAQFPETVSAVNTMSLKSKESVLLNDELLVIAKIVFAKTPHLQTVESGKKIIDVYLNQALYISVPDVIYITDYLRAIGIALPFYDHETNVEYTVADLIENGTITLINADEK